MRFSISARRSISWRRRFSCSRSSGVPWSRRGSVGGSRASSRRTWVSICCCVSCSCSICFFVSSLASPNSVSAEGGSGEVARPAWASPPPARLAWAIAWAFSGASPERELTRITSSGVSWNTRLKPSGSTKRTNSNAPCAAIDTASATCSVDSAQASAPQAARRLGHRRLAGPRLGARRRRRRSSAGRRRRSSSSAPAASAATAVRVVEAGDDRRV